MSPSLTAWPLWNSMNRGTDRLKPPNGKKHQGYQRVIKNYCLPSTNCWALLPSFSNKTQNNNLTHDFCVKSSIISIPAQIFSKFSQGELLNSELKLWAHLWLSQFTIPSDFATLQMGNAMRLKPLTSVRCRDWRQAPNHIRHIVGVDL
jgi:hypothetical protein